MTHLEDRHKSLICDAVRILQTQDATDKADRPHNPLQRAGIQNNIPHLLTRNCQIRQIGRQGPPNLSFWPLAKCPKDGQTAPKVAWH